MAYDPKGGRAVPVITLDANDLVENGGTYTLDKGPSMALLFVTGGSGGGLVGELVDLSDVNSSTPTTGNILRADGVDWESVPLTNYAILHSDFAGTDGILRKTGASTYEVVKVNFAGTAAPTADEDSGDGYAVGSIWIDTTNDEYYVCVDASVGAAVWLRMGSGSGSGGMTYSQTLAATVANTTDETSLFYAGRGTKFIAANTVQQGTALRITGNGFLGTTGTPNLTIKIYLGATEICSSGATALGATLTNAGFRFIVNAVFRTTGATGTLIAGGYFEHDDGTIKNIVKATETTIDTTVEQEIIVTATWGTADALNTITSQYLKIEKLDSDGMVPVNPTELTAQEV